MNATLDNTVFWTFVTHDVEKFAAPLRKTADYFGVPLVFTRYGGGLWA